MSNVVVAILAIALFIFGMACFGFAFQVAAGYQFIVFFGGIMCCTGSLFIPIQFWGKSERSW